MRRHRTTARGVLLLFLALGFAGAALPAGQAKGAVPTLIFPVAGPTTYTDDFGQPRAGGPHQGNDLLAAKRTPVVAVESGKITFWTTSASAGCMLYLHGASGTMYEYIHLNNDLTNGNDNRGKCVPGVAYAPGLKNGAKVTAGQMLGYVGDSGDANGIHPHLHFEVHPKGGKAVSPFPFLKKAAHLLIPAPAAGSPFTLRLTGTVVAADPQQLTINVASLTAWPSHLKQSKLNRIVTLTLPTAETFTIGEKLVAWTLPSQGTVPALSGAPGVLSLDRSQPL
jgi:hypothetical protein